MKIMGIDPGSKTTGWAVFNEKGLLYYGKLKFSGSIHDSQDLCRKLGEGYSRMSELLEIHKPQCVFIESQFVGSKKTDAVLKLCYFMASLTLAATHRKIPVKLVSPKEAKAFVTGYGDADKDTVREYINQAYGLRLGSGDNDVSDAIAIAWTGCDIWEEAA